MHHKYWYIHLLYANHDNGKLTAIIRITVIMNADYFPVDNCVQNSDNGVIIPESSDGKKCFLCHEFIYTRKTLVFGKLRLVFRNEQGVYT